MIEALLSTFQVRIQPHLYRIIVKFILSRPLALKNRKFAEESDICRRALLCFTDVSDFGGVSEKSQELFVLPRSSCGISAVYNLYLYARGFSRVEAFPLFPVTVGVHFPDLSLSLLFKLLQCFLLLAWFC